MFPSANCLRLLLALLISAQLLAGSRVASAGLATGPYSSMRMCLERTFLNVNVISVRVRVGPKAQGHLRALAFGREYSPELAVALANAAVRADEAQAILAFQRTVELEQLLSSLRKGTREANQIGWIDAATAASLRKILSDWFRPLSGRSFAEGDQLIFWANASRLSMALVDKNGKRRLNRSTKFSAATTALLAFFFVPRSDLREPLLRSLFSSEAPDC